MGSADVTQPPPWQYPNSPTVNGGNVNLIGRPISLRQEIAGQMGLGPAASGQGSPSGIMPSAASGGLSTAASQPGRGVPMAGGTPAASPAPQFGNGNIINGTTSIPMSQIQSALNSGYKLASPDSGNGGFNWGYGGQAPGVWMTPPPAPAQQVSTPVHMASRSATPSAGTASSGFTLQQQVTPTHVAGWPGLTATQTAPAPTRR